MKEKLVIVGAGGHGRVVADIARACGYKDIVFLDDNDKDISFGKVSDFNKYIEDSAFVVAIGNSKIREQIQNMLIENNCDIETLVHPNAVIGSEVNIGIGTVVMAGTVINTGTSIGDGVIVNTSSSMDHDNVIGNFAHISVGSHMAGTVTIGKHTWVGAGATVSNNVCVCDDCTIGAGAVVIKDIEESGIYIGAPARRKHSF